MKVFKIIITDYPDTDGTVAEIWYKNDLITVVDEETIDLFNKQKYEYIFESEDYKIALKKAIEKLK